MERVEMRIAGMSCGHCVAAVRKALARVPGLSMADVAVGSATLEVEDAATTTPVVQRAVEEAGYQVVGVGPVALTSAAVKSGGGCCGGGGKCG